MPRLRITSDVPVVLHAFRYNSSPPAFLQMYLQSCMRSDITLVLLHSFRLPVVLHAFRYNSSPPEFVQMYLQSCIPSDYLQSCMSSDVPVVLHAFRCNSSPPECVQMYLQSSCIPSDYLQSCMRSDVPAVLHAFSCTCSPPECVQMYLQSSCMRSDAPVVLMHAFRCTCSPPACLQMYLQSSCMPSRRGKGDFFYCLSGDCEIRYVLRKCHWSLAQRAQQTQYSVVAPFLGYKDKIVLFLLRPGITQSQSLPLLLYTENSTLANQVLLSCRK